MMVRAGLVASLTTIAFATSCSWGLPETRQALHLKNAHSDPKNVREFTYSIERGVLATADRYEAVRRNGSAAVVMGPSRLYVEFENTANSNDINSVFSILSARSVTQVRLPLFSETKTTLLDTTSFEVELDLRDVTLDRLSIEATKFGLQGHYTFASQDAAKTLQQALLLMNQKRDRRVKHVGLDLPAEPDGFTYEGNCYVSPTIESTPNQELTGGLWFHGDYVSGGRAGNQINGSSYSVWDHATGAGIIVAVVDNDFLLPGEAVNSQLLGDSPTYWKWNFENDSENIAVYDPDNSPSNGHGRKMASVLFSKPNDRHGTAGVAFGATPMLLHVYSDSGAAYDAFDISQAVDTARINGAQVINMSFSAPIAQELAIFAPYHGAILAAYDQGIVLVASTGNKASDGYTIPAGYGQVMGVSGHDWHGEVAWFFSTNEFANSSNADIYANAVEGVFAGKIPCPNLNAVNEFYGTSGAAALVSGTCALLRQQGKITSTDAAIIKIRNDAFERPDGRRILNARKAVTSP